MIRRVHSGVSWKTSGSGPGKLERASDFLKSFGVLNDHPLVGGLEHLDDFSHHIGEFSSSQLTKSYFSEG
jgi:hypothetical protein